MRNVKLGRLCAKIVLILFFTIFVKSDAMASPCSYFLSSLEAAKSQVNLLLSSLDLKIWEPLYGAEYTFSNSQIYSDADRDKYHEKMMELTEDYCLITSECTAIRNEKGLRITYTDGWWYQLSRDPGNIEIQTKPTSLKDLERMQGRIQKHIFDVAAKTGLYPRRWRDQGGGGGHIHIGVQSTFGENALLFRNFIVDYMNHPALAWNTVGSRNAWGSAPLALYPESLQREFWNVIKEFDEGKISGIYNLAFSIQERVYKKMPLDLKRPEKYQALNVTRIVNYPNAPEEWTIELRPSETQYTAEEFTLTAKLFQSRILYLSTLHEPIPFLNIALPTTLRETLKRLLANKLKISKAELYKLQWKVIYFYRNNFSKIKNSNSEYIKDLFSGESLQELDNFMGELPRIQNIGWPDSSPLMKFLYKDHKSTLQTAANEYGDYVLKSNLPYSDYAKLLTYPGVKNTMPDQNYTVPQPKNVKKFPKQSIKARLQSAITRSLIPRE